MIKMMLICMVKTIGRVFHILDINFSSMHVITTVLNLQEVHCDFIILLLLLLPFLLSL
jgi:hypothetical protein